MLSSSRTRRRLGTRHKGLRLFGDDGGLYLLLDQFTNDLAAGAVNGTLATPGGAGTVAQNTRTVTDTNSKLSVAGGVANYAAAANAAGDPGLWYGSQARVLGKSLLGRVVLSATATRVNFGFDSAATGAILDAFNFSSTTALTIIVNGTGIVTDAYAAATYDLALVMRSTGHYYFIKGGAFTNWTLLWQSATTSAAGLPGIIAASTASLGFTADDIRIPTALYIPIPNAYDTFTRANGALGSSETVGPDGQTVTARAWTLQAGTIEIVSNAASLTIIGGGLNDIATLDGISADVLVASAITRTLGSGGIVLRYVDANNYLRATHDGTNALLEQVVAGVATTLRTGVATYAAGAPIRVIVSGTEGRLFYNNLAVGAVFTVPASVSTLHGLYGSDLSCLWDNFQVMPRGTGNEYVGLDTY